MLVFDPKEDNSPDFYHRKRRQGRDLLKKANRDVRFAFDEVFSMTATNMDVYNRTTKNLLDSLLDGFNCSGNLFNVFQFPLNVQLDDHNIFKIDLVFNQA